MTESFSLIVDGEERLRVRESLDENLFVGAGAGTGKTSALVSRIISLVSSGRAGMNGLAAITFTETAAGELRERVRQGLEESARDEKRVALERERCARAVREMELASIQTLHGFAQSLLRERPLDAGLPPAFSVVDDIQAQLRFQEAWDDWVRRSLESGQLGQKLLRACRLGLTLEDLRGVAVNLHRDYDLVEGTPFPEVTQPEMSIESKLMAAADKIIDLLPLSVKGMDDRLYIHASAVVDLARRVRDIGGGDSGIALLVAFGRLSTNLGRQADWNVTPGSGVNGCKLLKMLLRDLESTRSAQLDELRRSVISPLLESVRCFVVELAARRKKEGRAEFHDLLVWARALLRDVPEVRRHFQSRFHHILVDELQDTDPIQAEIAFFLAGRPDDAAAMRTKDWRRIVPAPGKLFVVGDPKQSIYRFRRADIGILNQVRHLLGSEAVSLRQNFRSQDGIINWTNHVFERWMGHAASGDRLKEAIQSLQADYEPLQARWKMGRGSRPFGVYRMGEALDGSTDDVRCREAKAVAAIARDVKDNRWQVRRDSVGALGYASFRDICLLLPTRTGLDALGDALEEANIPYRVESQFVVLNTEDVRETLRCLRAIDNPADQVAVVAALRSSAFACSDVELLEFVEAGGEFNYFRPGVTTGPVAESLETLRHFHDRRIWVPIDQLIEQFIRERSMVHMAFARRRPRERLRRLRFVVEQARRFVRSEGGSLRGFLDWMDRQVEEGAQTVEVPVPESDEDCVRVMTVHAAKGLEFPIVILTGLGSKASHRAHPVIVDRSSGRIEVRVKALGQAYFKTEGFDDANEREVLAEVEEQVRLAYVACTRARDYLVLSLFRKEQENDGSPAALLEKACATRPDLWREIEVGIVSSAKETITLPPVLNAGKFASSRDQWEEERGAVIARASMRAAQPVTRIARLDKEEPEGGEEEHRRGRGGTRLGKAVHAVLQSIDLVTGEGLASASRAQAEIEGISARWREVASLVKNALGFDVIQRLAGRYVAGEADFYREVFVSAVLDGQLVEGFIDLLIDGPDGMVVVDYKTDAVNGEEEMEEAVRQHEIQMGLYAWAAQEVTGRPVREAVLLFLRPQAERSFTDIDGLVAEAKKAASGRIAPGYALSS